MDNVIVAALDADTETLCKQHNIPYHSDKDLRYTFDVMATGGQPLHDPNAKVTMEGRAFQQIGALKAAFLLFLLNRGHRVLVSDVDTVWLNDPRDWFERDDLPTRTDVAVSTDCLSHTEPAPRVVRHGSIATEYFLDSNTLPGPVVNHAQNRGRALRRPRGDGRGRRGCRRRLGAHRAMRQG